MPARFPVPIQEDLRDILVGLLSRGVAVDKVPPLALDEDDRGFVVELLEDDDEVGALCVFDDRFAVRAGAALVMVPPAAAEEDLAKAELAEHAEVAQEVVNVLSRLLNSPSTPHLRLGARHPLPGELPAPVSSLLETPVFRRDFAVLVDGYGDGRFSILVS